MNKLHNYYHSNTCRRFYEYSFFAFVYLIAKSHKKEIWNRRCKQTAYHFKNIITHSILLFTFSCIFWASLVSKTFVLPFEREIFCPSFMVIFLFFKWFYHWHVYNTTPVRHKKFMFIKSFANNCNRPLASILSFCCYSAIFSCYFCDLFCHFTSWKQKKPLCLTSL